MSETTTDASPPSIATMPNDYGVFLGDPEEPLAVTINAEVLRTRQEELRAWNRYCLWDPREDSLENRGPFVGGFETGQYGAKSLADVIAFGKRIGGIIQPSANHIDFARAATDEPYRKGVFETFKAAGQPLMSASIHCDAYAALAIRSNPRAGMFLPKPVTDALEIGDGLGGPNPERISEEHLAHLGQMFLGAGQFGIRALHLFWGEPTNMSRYSWPPRTASDIANMRKLFVQIVTPYIELAARLGIYLCHERHWGTIGWSADDLIAIWKELGCPDNFVVGEDPSHDWNGEPWYVALQKLRAAGMKVILAHAKNVAVRDGLPKLQFQADDRQNGVFFTTLDDPHGLVSLPQYVGELSLSGMLEFWNGELGLPAPIYAEAEFPFAKIVGVTAAAVEHLNKVLGWFRLPQGHFTDGMVRK